MKITTVLFDLDGTLLPMDQDIFIKAYLGGLVKAAAPSGYEPRQLAGAIMRGTDAMVNNDGGVTNEEAFWLELEKIYGSKIMDDIHIFDRFYQTDFQNIKDFCGYTPDSAKVVAAIKSSGMRVALATNPLFPTVATESRIRWAGLSPSDFEIYTTYETSRHCKPNPDYYKDVIEALGVCAEECLMVGNDVSDDMVAATLGMQVFLLTDCLINKNGEDISRYPNGSFADLVTYLGDMNIYAQNHNMTDLSMLLGRRDDCPCGMPHSCEIGSVIIRRGAIEELVALTAGFEHVLLVCDENTRRAAGERVDKLLGSKIRSRVTYVSDGFLVPDEAAVEILKGGVSTQTDLIIGVGSGVINDLCKYVSFELGLPYFIVATAPSMDGYASKGAAMLFGNMKVTTNAAPPAAIIADTDVLKDAPLEMLKAGYGDIIGKYSCLNDWRLSHIVNGEPLCEYVYSLTRAATDSVAPLAEAILSRDEESIATLMRALIVVGIAMAYMGNSRPASGSEHHLSHFFEVVGLLRGEPYFCHGIDVAYSTYLTALIRSALIACEKPAAHPFSPSEWEENIKRVYATENNSRAADGIIEMQNRLGWIFEDKMPIYEEKWQQIRSVLLDSPTPDEVEAMLRKIELPLDSFKKTYSPEKIRDAVRYAKDLKDRYTVLWLYAVVLGNEICEQI